MILLKGLELLGLFILLAFLAEWIDRRLKGRIQQRFGPIYTGKAGILQPLADWLKLLQKEDFRRKSLIFELSPILLLAISLLCLFTIPVTGPNFLSFKGDFILLVFLFNCWCFLKLTLMSGAKGRFAFYGGFRQLILFSAYEIPFIFSIAAFALHWRAFSLIQLGGFSPLLLIAFAVFIITSLAKLRKKPFDIPHAKQEIVAGIETEISGKKLALLRLSNNLEFLFVASLGGTLLCGPATTLSGFLARSVPFIALLSFLSAIIPRYRIDQAAKEIGKWLYPISMGGLVLASL